MRSDIIMGFLSVFKTALFLSALLSFISVTLALGQGQVVHKCPYDVWCAVVAGNVDTPVSWIQQAPGQLLISNFEDVASDEGIAMMCTRDPTAPTISVTQLEYTWTEPQTAFDISIVAGDPFLNEGFSMTATDLAPQPQFSSSCAGAYCAPGDVDCNDVYVKSNDDYQGMRTCSNDVIINLTLCSG
ncbi:hypothetical protein PV11_01320 [Exophiala sideris]|uniref:Ig-like domain-containing protein n=1 Tax=Exophiala sideris TaxID=1016849 RepID=A0A0D1XCQ5_9EURO|nr:hypothetical protein PV11_01320 [Exophiala sideris]